MPARTHGRSRTKIYRIYHAMLNRCYRSADQAYKNYGGRGITVCDRWRSSFEAFLGDMGERPSGLTLDRRNNDGNYSPDNCRWASREEQRRNQREHSRRSCSCGVCKKCKNLASAMRLYWRKKGKQVA